MNSKIKYPETAPTSSLVIDWSKPSPAFIITGNKIVFGDEDPNVVHVWDLENPGAWAVVLNGYASKLAYIGKDGAIHEREAKP